MKTAEWIAALRSGKYKQGRYLLCNEGRFCCLGVLADISGVPKLNKYQEGQLNETYMFNIPGVEQADWKQADWKQASPSMIPVPLWPTFLEDLDLSMMVPAMDESIYGCDTLHNRLTKMNDHGLTFNEIANYIEEVYNANK